MTARPFELHRSNAHTSTNGIRAKCTTTRPNNSDCSNHSSYSRSNARHYTNSIRAYARLHDRTAVTARSIRATTVERPTPRSNSIYCSNHSSYYRSPSSTCTNARQTTSDHHPQNNLQLHTVLDSSTGAVVAPQLCVRSGTP